MGKNNKALPASDKDKLNSKTKIIHPRSRKLKQTVRKEHRSNKIAAKQQLRKRSVVAPRLAACRSVATLLSANEQVAALPCFSLAQALELVRTYLGRHDDELAELEAARQQRPNQQRKRAAREDELRAAARTEQDAFFNGR